MVEPIKILQVIGIMNRGGAETLLMNLYRQIDTCKVQFDFVEHTTEEAVFDKEILTRGGKIFHCPKFNGKNYFEYKKWWEEFFSEHAKDYTAVHGHIGSTAAMYLSWAKKSGLFTIAHSHNTNGTYNTKELLYRFISFPTRYIADYFISCSKKAGEDRFGKKIVRNEDKYQQLNNSIDTKIYRYNPLIRDCIRKEFGFDSEIVIGHIGRFEAQKNHKFLIDVFSRVLEKNKKAKLLLVGTGPLEEEIKQLVETREMKQQVIFTGVRSDVFRVLQGMDILVMPSLYEGLPVSMVEAQASGLPCVISDGIPRDCEITDLVTVMSLKDSDILWSEHILQRAKETRKDYSIEVKSKGFDIEETAQWLEQFYIKHSGVINNGSDNIYTNV